MKKIVIGLLAVLVLLIAVSGCNSYNGLVKMDEDVKTKWSNVETQYQRRSDLIPNLVSTVKGAAKFEQGTLTAVIEARASASKITIDPNKLNAENIEKYQQKAPIVLPLPMIVLKMQKRLKKPVYLCLDSKNLHLKFHRILQYLKIQKFDNKMTKMN